MINFDLKLIAVSLSVLVSIIISYIIIRNDRKSITNKSFLLFTVFTIFWGVVNYLNYQINFSNKGITFLLLRLNLLFGLLQAFSLFYFFYVFPNKNYKNIWWISYLIFPFVILVSILIFTKYVFSEITVSQITGNVLGVKNGFGIILFGLLATGLVIYGLITIYNKYHKYKDLEKIQARLILNGSVFMFSLIIFFNLILPNFFNNSNYISISAIYTIPFLILTSYSIIKYHLFNVKVITTELTVFILWIFLLVRTLIASSYLETLINGSLFILVVIVGVLLIKSVRKEVEQREKLETLKNELEKANSSLEEANVKLQSLDKLKTEFVSLASHQLRSPLTAIKGYTSMLLEGDYGEIIPSVKEIMDRILESSNNLTLVVEDLLNVAKIEQGGMKYQMDKFDFGELARNTVRDLSITAEKKGIKLIDISPTDQKYFVSGDKEKLRQVLINLIDNSLKYTPTGQIEVNMNFKDGKIILSIKDTGVGISKEVIGNLFAKFSRGDGAKLNSSGSGLGLYLVKEIIEAHHGRVWVESEGIGHGSTFFVEIEGIE